MGGSGPTPPYPPTETLERVWGGSSLPSKRRQGQPGLHHITGVPSWARDQGGPPWVGGVLTQTSLNAPNTQGGRQGTGWGLERAVSPAGSQLLSLLYPTGDIPPR